MFSSHVRFGRVRFILRAFLSGVLPAAAVLAVALGLSARRAMGADIIFNATNDLWNVAGNWNPMSVPGSGDRADIAFGDTATIQAGDTESVATLYIGADNDGSQGNDGNFGAPGTTGNGTLNQSGGSLTVSTWGPVLGNQAGSTGTYNLSGGSFTFTGTDYVRVGQAGTGFFNISNAATASLTKGNLSIGSNGGSTGTLAQSGTSNVTLGSGQLYVGDAGNGTYTLTDSSSLNIANDIVIGRSTGAVGLMTVSSNATVTQTGGWSYVGVNGGQGTLNVGDSSSFTADGPLYVGLNGGKGFVTQTGGTVNFGAQVTGNNDNPPALGIGINGTGTYTISGGNLTEAVSTGGKGSNWNYIGDNNGTGTLNVNGGTVFFDGRLHIAGGGGSTGTVTQTAGTVNANGNNGDTVFGDGNGDVGTYNLSGGAFNGTTVEIGHWDNSKGTLNLSGTGQFNVAGGLSLGTYNSVSGTTTTGTIAQTGGALSVGGQLNVGDGSGGGGQKTAGNYSVSAGTATVTGNLVIGNSGTATGTLTQSGTGAITVGSTIYVANGGSGTLNIQGGTLTSNGVNGQSDAGLIIGNTGSGGGYGIVNQSGGTFNNGGGWAKIGENSSGGEFNLSGGTFTTASRLQMSNGGTFNISGTGSASIGAEMVVYNGTVNPSGGQLNLPGGINLDVGWGGSAMVNQTGGTVNVTGHVEIASAGSTGVYNLSGGTLLTPYVSAAGPGGGGTNIAAFQFNGGTFKESSANQGAFLNFSTANASAVTIGNGGATIDSNGFSITAGHSLDAVQFLNAASGGQSLTGIVLQAGEGTGYTGTPNVYITGGGGIGASAIATMSGGTITGFTITNPGSGYTSAPTITLEGGGLGPVNLSSADSALGAATSTGGLTVIDSSGTGMGIVTLDQANTFVGPTAVTSGKLDLANSLALQNSTLTTAGITFDSAVGSHAFTLGGLSGSGNINLADTGLNNVALSVGNNNASTTYSGTLSGGGSLTKIGTGTLTLSTGANTFTGATNVNQGTLALGPAGSLGDTTITVGNGSTNNGTLRINGNYTIGSSSAQVIVSGGTNTTGQGTLGFNPLELSPSMLTVNGSLSFASATASAALNMNLGNTSTDTITSAGAVTFNAGGTILGLTQLSGPPISTGTYTLISSTFGGIINRQFLTFAGGATKIASNGDLLSLSSTSNTELLTVSALPIPTNAYWYGVNSASWTTYNNNNVSNPTNWVTTQNGTTDAGGPPGGGTTNVFFNANAATGNFSTTLDEPTTSIASLTFLGNTASPNSVMIAPGSNANNTLVIGTGGITNASGAGANTISAPLVLNGSQPWTNNSASLFTVSGNVTGNGNTLTVGGSGATSISGQILDGSPSGMALIVSGGTVTLTASNKYTGLTTVNGGNLVLAYPANDTGTGTIGTSSGLVINSGGTVTLAGGDNSLLGFTTETLPVTINAGGLLTVSSGFTDHLGSLTLAGGTLASAAPTGDASIFGTYNLDQTVTAGGGSAPTSTISATGVALTQPGGTVFNVAASSGSGGIDLDVTGTFVHTPSAADNGLIKTGTGTMRLDGNNTYSGPTTVSQWTLIHTCANNSVNTANAGEVSVGTLSGSNGVLLISGGALNATNTTAPSLSVGPLSGDAGALILTSKR